MLKLKVLYLQIILVDIIDILDCYQILYFCICGVIREEKLQIQYLSQRTDLKNNKVVDMKLLKRKGRRVINLEAKNIMISIGLKNSV